MQRYNGFWTIEWCHLLPCKAAMVCKNEIVSPWQLFYDHDKETLWIFVKIFHN